MLTKVTALKTREKLAKNLAWSSLSLALAGWSLVPLISVGFAIATDQYSTAPFPFLWPALSMVVAVGMGIFSRQLHGFDSKDQMQIASVAIGLAISFLVPSGLAVLAAIVLGTI